MIYFLACYALLMMGWGLIISRRSKDSSDFFVAGRGLGAGLLAATLLAANIGAGSTIGATGLGYREGLAAWWWVGAAGIGSVLLAFTVAPKIWRIAQENNLYTVGDYLEFRYHKRVRALASVLLWIGSLIILAGQLIGGSALLHVVAGVEKITGDVIAAVIVTFYFALGGLQTAVRINLLQLIVKLTGFLLALFYLLNKNHLFQNDLPAAYFSLTHQGFATPLFYLATITPAFMISPGIVQKVFAARDEQAARRGVGLNAIGLLLFAIVPPLLGMLARTSLPPLANSEQALPALLVQALPFWLGALLLAAIFAAELSAADAVLFMLTTSLSKDLYQAYLKPGASDPQLLRAARIIAILCGALAVGLAIGLETVYSALTIFYTLLTAALFLPMIAGLYFPRVRAHSALLSMLASVSVTFAIHGFTHKQGYFGIPPIIFGIAAGMFVMGVLVGRDGSHK